MGNFLINVNSALASFYVEADPVISTNCSSFYRYTIYATDLDNIDITLVGNHENEVYILNGVETPFTDSVSGIIYNTSLILEFIIQNSGAPGVFPEVDIIIDNNTVSGYTQFTDSVQRINDEPKCGADANFQVGADNGIDQNLNLGDLFDVIGTSPFQTTISKTDTTISLSINAVVPDNEILFGTGTGIESSPSLTWDGLGLLVLGNITANSLIKSGGLSTEFLKADGSVDNNEYATTSLVGSEFEEEINFSGGETTWVLSDTPSALFPHRLYAGTTSGGGLILLDEGVDYTLSGNTITYLSPVLPIDEDEKHIIHYNLPSAPSGYSNPNSDVRRRNLDVYEPINTSAYYKNGVIYDSRNLQLLVITDIHGDVTAVNNCITMMDEFSTIDGGLNLGDTCINNFLDDFSFVNPLMTIGKPFLIAIGNHDEGVGTLVATTGTTAGVYAKFVQPYEGTIGGTHVGASYYYKDWTTYKIRTIVLYEYDDNDDLEPLDPLNYRVSKSSRCWSQAQIDWLVDTLNNTPSDYSVMIMMHQVVVDQLTWIDDIFTDINHIAPGDSNTVSDPDLIPEIINAWINGTTLISSYPFTGSASYKTDITVNADFTVRGAGDFICYLAGHAHVDAVGTVPGYANQLQLVFTCATSDAARNQYGDLQRQSGQRSEDCFNIVSFDTSNRKIKIVRVGAQITFDMRQRDYIEISY